MRRSSSVRFHLRRTSGRPDISLQSETRFARQGAMQVEREDVPSAQMAVPDGGIPPRNDDVFDLVLVGAKFDQKTSVICMTDAALTFWRSRPAVREQPIPGLTLVDGRAGWSAQWRPFFASQRFDLIVLHGLNAAMRSDYLPKGYARRIVSAVSHGLIVFA